MHDLMQDVRTIFFDLDDTLVDNAYAQRQALKDTYEHFRAVFHMVSYDVFVHEFEKVNNELWAQLSRGEITPRELNTQRFLRTLQRFSVMTSLVKYDQRDAFLIEPYFAERFLVHTKEVPHATHLLSSLREKYALGVLTNGLLDIQTRRIHDLGWKDMFDHVVTPDVAGAMKPAAEFFQAAERVSGCVPGQLAFVGDSHYYDVAAAKRRGWHSIWFNPASHAAPDGSADVEVRTLADVAALFLRIPA